MFFIVRYIRPKWNFKFLIYGFEFNFDAMAQSLEYIYFGLKTEKISGHTGA